MPVSDPGRHLHSWVCSIGVLFALATACGVSSAQCEEWLPAWGDSSFSNCQSLAVADHDGPGPLPPVLYAAGSATTPTGSSLSWWDTRMWRGVPGITSTVSVLRTLDAPAGGFQAQTLLAAGSITTIMGPGRTIAAWNGSAFAALGPAQVADFSTTTIVRAITTWDPDGPGPLEPWIVVSGTFTRFGGVNANSVAAWDGVQWRALGAGFAGEVSAATSFDPDADGPQLPLLIVGLQGGTVRAWNGSAWSQMGVTFGARINALTTHDADGDGPNPPRLYACSDASSPAWARIGLWDGAAWIEAGADTPTYNNPGTKNLLSLDLDGAGSNPPTLVVLGHFGPAFTDATFATVAMLSNGVWVRMQGSPDLAASSVGGLYAGALIDPDGPDGPRGVELVLGGTTGRVGGARGVTYAGMGAWNGQRFGTLGNEITGGIILDLAWHDDDGPGPIAPTVYAAGRFEAAGGELAEGLARWDGSRFVGLGTPTLGSNPARFISRLASHDPDGPGPQSPWLVGLDSTTAGAGFVVQWTGTTWVTLGTGTSGTTYGIASFDSDGDGPGLPMLVRAGSYSTQGLMRLSGTTWVAAGTPRAGPFYAFTGNGHDQPDPETPTLYALGQSELVRWTGYDWVRLGNLIGWNNNSRIPELCWWDRDGNGPALPEVVVGVTSFGLFYNAAGYDGSAWRQIGNTFSPDTVKGLGTHDPDGDGPVPPQLFLGRGNTALGGVRRLADSAWTGLGAGIQWNPPGNASDEGVYAFLDFDPDGDGPQPPELWIAGGFSHAGGQPARNFARWRFLTPPPAFVQFADDTPACRHLPASIAISTSGATSVTWQVREQAAWTTLADGPLTYLGQVIGSVTGSATGTLTITWNDPAGGANFRAVLANACGTTTGNEVVLSVSECALPCDPDVNCDGAVNGVDIEIQELAVGGDVTDYCHPDADFNQDGAVNGTDIEALELVVGGGPCP